MWDFLRGLGGEQQMPEVHQRVARESGASSSPDWYVASPYGSLDTFALRSPPSEGLDLVQKFEHLRVPDND